MYCITDTVHRCCYAAKRHLFYIFCLNSALSNRVSKMLERLYKQKGEIHLYKIYSNLKN